MLVQVSNDLQALERKWALIGGIAVGVRAEPRFTRDIDIAVAVLDDDDAEGLAFALGQRGYSIRTTLEQKVLGRLATIRAVYGRQSENAVVVDFLLCSSGIEGLAVQHAQIARPWPRLAIPVARVGHLVAMKLLAESDVRLQDRLDLRALRAQVDDEEAELAREACATIEALGTNRGKPLTEMLGAYLAEPKLEG